MSDTTPEKKKPTRRKKSDKAKRKIAGAQAPALSSAPKPSVRGLKRVVKERAPEVVASHEVAEPEVSPGVTSPKGNSATVSSMKADSPTTPSPKAASAATPSPEEYLSSGEPARKVGNAASAVEVTEGTGSSPTPVKRSAPNQTKQVKKSTLVVTVVALMIVALVAAFVSIRWFIHDDASLIQGEWCVDAAGETLVFDDHQMKLTKSVTYEYVLDTVNKEIYYSFSDLKGQSNYYFSLDGKQLVITEGEAPNIFVQLGILPNPAIAADTVDDNVIVLSKISDNTDAKPAAKVENNSTEEADTVGADIVSGKTDATEGE